LKPIIYAIIPVKDPCESKSRLSNVFNTEVRRRLTLLMLEDVISTLKRSKLLTRVVVVSPSLEVLNLGKNLNCEVVREGPRSIGLNKAVELGVEYSGKLGAEVVLILPADIPMIGLEDVDNLLSSGLRLEKPYVVISPSKDGGTNALMLSLPTRITFKFGPNSYMSHLQEAKRTRSNFAVFHSKNIEMDVDDEIDLCFFLKSLESGKCRKSWLYLREVYKDLCN